MPSQISMHSVQEPAQEELRGVLIITYTFAPSAWVGVHRSLKYCKYLQRFGWWPTVLTARPGRNSFTDRRLLRDLPAKVKVVRTWDFDPAEIESRLAARKVARIRTELAGADRQAASERMNEIVAASEEAVSLAGRLTGFVKLFAKRMPDSHIFWLPFAIVAGSWILATRRIDVIYCSSPPHSSQILGRLLARIFRKPFVVDFRDPWYVMGSVRHSCVDQPRWRARWEAAQKRAVVRSAAHIVCVSTGERAELLNEYPDLDSRRVSVITNGFDAEDEWDAEQIARDPDRVVFLHAGTIYPGVADELFGALEVLLETDPSFAKSIRLDLIGDVSFEYLPTIDRLARQGVLRKLGMVGHAHALGMMKSSDVLLILMGGDAYEASHLPSKLFEYLHAGKAIVAVAPRGEMSDILEMSGNSKVVAVKDVPALVATLKEVVGKVRQGTETRERNEAFVAKFQRRALTERLAGVLTEVAQRRESQRHV